MVYKMVPDIYARGRGRTSNIMDYCVLFAYIMWVTSATIMGDECDWTGSGLSTSSENRVVTPIYLRCTAGRVRWLYPRGALRVLLRLPGQDKNFRACIKIHPDKETRLAARIFLEGPRSLLPLYSPEESEQKAIRCFQSRGEQAALYIESTISDVTNKRISEIEYDLQPLARGTYDATEECRPCSAAEMIHAFCTSDLVTRGTIQGIENEDEMEVSRLAVRVTKLIRHTTEDLYVDYLDENENRIDNIFQNNISKEVVLHVAQHCAVQHGVGEFVFMARSKLGDLTLQCAPRLEDWVLLINSLSDDNNIHCFLKTFHVNKCAIFTSTTHSKPPVLIIEVNL